jgi:hypothetical protein
VAALRSKLAEAADFATRIRDYTAEKNVATLLGPRIAQAAKLAVRMAATLGAVDSRLDKFTDRVSQAQEDLRELRIKTLRRIWLATVAVMLLLLWMGAGQAALSL